MEGREKERKEDRIPKKVEMAEISLKQAEDNRNINLSNP